MSSTQTLGGARAVGALNDRPRWFSANPDRAWAEKFFLIYSPIWMILMGIMMPTGWVLSFSDTALLVHGVLVAAPIFLVPLLLRRHANPDRPWYDSYWFKANLYIGLFGFFGNYFGSEYFFDVLGMVYNMPNVTTALDAKLVGSGEQPVPVIMYLYTHAYFITYHTTAIIVLRRIMTAGIPASRLLFLPIVFAVGYFWAWLETKAMANPMMASSFYYTNMEGMLAYGSAIYALYFIASFPIYYYLDESESKRWDLFKVSAAGFSASMLTFYLLDGAAWWVGSIGG